MASAIMAREAARNKEDKYKHMAEQMDAVHLPFAVESMGGLSKSAQQLIREIHHSAGSHCTWRDANAIGKSAVPPPNASYSLLTTRSAGMATEIMRSVRREAG